MIGPADVEAARNILRGVAHRTPVLTSATLDELTGAQVFCKAENLQRTGSFKFRGAYNAVAGLDAAQRAAGLVTGSSGNHAAALALAGALMGVKVTVVMPGDAPANKRAAAQAYGAEVLTYDRYTEDRDQRCADLVAQRGSTFVPAFDHPAVMAGQGTVAAELLEQTGPLDMLLVCVGGGGLMAGCATAAKAAQPGIELVGVEPEAGDDHRRSLCAGERIALAEVPRSIADGQLVTTPGRLTFAVNRVLVDRFVVVTDDAIIATMVLLFERLKAVVEPSGACALAALVSGAVSAPGARIGVTLSGGNIDTRRFASLLAS